MRLAALFLAASAALADPSPYVEIPGVAKQPQVAVDADGNVYVVMVREEQIEVSVSTDRGKTYGAPVVAIDAKRRAQGGLQRGPRIAVDAKKAIHVTAPLSLDEGADRRAPAELYYARSTDCGKTWSSPIRVNDADEKAAEALHWLAVSSDGVAHVAWIDARKAGSGNNCLAYARVTGDKAEKNQLLAGPVCECCAPGVSLDAKGNPVVIYREGAGTSNRRILALLSRNGGRSFSKPVPINQGESKMDG